MKPAVTLVCAAYARRNHLPGLLSSLCAQTFEQWECLVMDESDDLLHAATVGYFGDPRITHVHCAPCRQDWGQTVKALGAEGALGQWLGFPNEDAYYVPTYLQQMVGLGTSAGLGLVYCDWLYDRMGYAPWDALPVTGHIDVGGFLVRRDVWRVHRSAWAKGKQTADGEFVEALVKAGVPHGKPAGVLYVKN